MPHLRNLKKEVMSDCVKFREAVELITSKFREPLEAKKVFVADIQDEVEETVSYARKFLNIDTESYQKVLYFRMLSLSYQRI